MNTLTSQKVLVVAVAVIEVVVVVVLFQILGAASVMVVAVVMSRWLRNTRLLLQYKMSILKLRGYESTGKKTPLSPTLLDLPNRLINTRQEEKQPHIFTLKKRKDKASMYRVYTAHNVILSWKEKHDE